MMGLDILYSTLQTDLCIVVFCETNERQQFPCSLYKASVTLRRPSLCSPLAPLSTRTSTGCASSQETYVVISACNMLTARCISTLASVSETHSKLSCIFFTIPCKCAVDERSWSCGSVSVRSEKSSPFRRARLATSVASGWRTRE